MRPVRPMKLIMRGTDAAVPEVRERKTGFEAAAVMFSNLFYNERVFFFKWSYSLYKREGERGGGKQMLYLVSGGLGNTRKISPVL